MMNWLSLDRKQLANVENSLKEIIARAADEDSHTQFTPLALCQELVQKIIDQGISPDKEWLVIANLEILFVVRAWFVYNGWSLDKLHYASASDRKLKFAKCLLGNENVSKYRYDQLEKWNPGMNFDVVLGNPPYGTGTRSGTRLWEEFIEKSFDVSKHGGYVLLVTPSTWLGSNGNKGSKIMRLKNIIHANFSNKIMTDYFPGVGGSQKFCYFMSTNEEPQGSSILEFDDLTIMNSLSNFELIPQKTSFGTEILILQRIMKFKEDQHVWFRRDNPKDKQDPQKWEVFVPREKSPRFKVSVVKNTDDTGYIFTSFDKEKCDNIAANLNLPLYQRFRWILRSGMAMNKSFTLIPIPSHKQMTNQELYEYFGLTQEEIDFIESTIKY